MSLLVIDIVDQTGPNLWFKVNKKLSTYSTCSDICSKYCQLYYSVINSQYMYIWLVVLLSQYMHSNKFSLFNSIMATSLIQTHPSLNIKLRNVRINPWAANLENMVST